MRKAVPLVAAAMVAGLGAVGCSGTADGGGGDPMSPPAANPYGGGSRVHELIGPAIWEKPWNSDRDGPHADACAAIPPDRTVEISGTRVIAIDRYDETGEVGSMGNMYVQDAVLGDPPVYAGVTVYSPSFSPPDLRVIEGDVVDVFGLLMEFAGPTGMEFNDCRTLPEIGGTMSFRFEEPPPGPVVIQAQELASYAGMRQYLGMLVRIDNLRLGDDPYDPPSGRYSIRIDVGGGVLEQDLPSITNEMFDLKSYLEGTGLPLQAGTEFSSVTGVVTYFYGTHLSPRSPADIVP